MDPTIGPVTQGFRSNPQFAWQPWGHTGRDQGCNIGTNCVSIADGYVIWADWGHKMPTALANSMMFVPGSADSGICVIIQHDGWRSGSFHLDSTHLHHKSTFHKGSVVKRGDSIGKTGNSGNSLGPHLHYEVFLMPCTNQPMFGRYNPDAQIAHEDKVAKSAVPVLRPNQRLNGSGPAKWRSRAHPDGVPVGKQIPPGQRENLLGYVIGHPVNQGGVNSNIWYVDKGEDGKSAHRYVWAGMFTAQTITGLPNLTPAPEPAKPSLKPNQRLAIASPAMQRSEPRRDDDDKNVVRLIAKGGVEEFTHWVIGEEIDSGGKTSNLWYKDSIGYVWAGGFSVISRTGLTEFVFTEPEPPVQPAEPYSFNRELTTVTEVHPAALNKFQYGSIPNPPSGVIFHQFSTSEPEENDKVNRFTVHIGSLVNTFTAEDSRVASVQVACEGVEAYQFVSLKDRAYHAGAKGNELWGIEMYGAMDELTMLTAAKVFIDMEKAAGKTLTMHRHNEFMATACGRHVDLERIASLVKSLRDPGSVVGSDKNMILSFLKYMESQVDPFLKGEK